MARDNRENEEELLRQLKTIRDHYINIDKLTEDLRRYPGFERVNKATVWRWMTKPTGRAGQAIKVLQSSRAIATLRIAEPRTLWILPSKIITSEPQGVNKPYGLLKTRYGIQVESKETVDGGTALQHLEKGEVDIALAATELVRNLGSDCGRLCSVAKAPIQGFSKYEVKNRYDYDVLLKDLKQTGDATKLGCLGNSALAEKSYLGFRNENAIAEAFINGRRIQGVGGWEPSLSRIKKKIQAKGYPQAIHDFPEGMLGTITIDAAVNVKQANPTVVRAYLNCLVESSQYFQEGKSLASFCSEIVKFIQKLNWGTKSSGELMKIFDNSSFGPSYLDPTALILLNLWDDEVRRLGPTPTT